MDRVVVSYMNIPRIISILFISLVLSFLVFQANSGAADAEDEKQVGAFGVEENAQALRNQLTAEGKNAYLRKKEVNGKTIYAVIVRESGDASAAAVIPDEEQVGVFSVEENAQALRNRFAAEGKYAYLRKKEVNGKTLYAVIVRVSEESLAMPEATPEAMPEATVEESAEAMPEATVEESAEAWAEAMAKAMAEKSAEAESVVEEVAAPAPSAYMEAVPHAVPVAPEPPEPVEEAPQQAMETPEPEPEPPMQVDPDVIPIKGLGISFEIFFPTYARVYEGPSFKSRRLGFREDVGMLDVLGDSPEGWLVVRSVNTGRTRYVPADDAKYFKLDRKGRRKGQLPARPLVK